MLLFAEITIVVVVADNANRNIFYKFIGTSSDRVSYELRQYGP